MRLHFFLFASTLALTFALAEPPAGQPAPGGAPGQPAPPPSPPPPPPGQPAPGQPGEQPPVPLPPGSPPPQPPGQPPGAQPSGGAKTPAPVPAAAPAVPVKAEDAPRVVRVNVTNQAWDFSRPWGKRAPFTRRAVGAILPGKRVLVSAELVANANYLEFESAEGANRTPASIIAVDYECNLALLKGEDDEFLTSFKPLEFTEAKVGETLNIWQLETTGVVLTTQGPMTTAEVSRYSADDSAFLIYRATAALQFRDSSFNLPVLKDGKLAGMLVRYDNTSNSAEIVPSPVIEHFLKDAEDAPYEGFPRTGIAYSATRDPQLRRYAGLAGKHSGGVYVTDVQKVSPAAQAGVKPGDVILSVDGQAIDQDGNYVDPTYGKLSFSHLVSTKHYHGEAVTMKLLRKGELLDIAVKIAHRDVASYVIEPYVIDRAPKFFILGGLVLQELSRQYLKEFGKDWEKRAPQELVYLDRYQNDLFEEGHHKLVILNRVLPMASTVGYEELHHLVVEKINGVSLTSIEDVPKALSQVTDGIHKVEFDSEPRVIYLDAKSMAAEEASLVQNYRLPATSRLTE